MIHENSEDLFPFPLLLYCFACYIVYIYGSIIMVIGVIINSFQQERKVYGNDAGDDDDNHTADEDYP